MSIGFGCIRFCCQIGGIAQLGERLNGIQEVMGSIPTISTNGDVAETARTDSVRVFHYYKRRSKRIGAEAA